MIDVLLLNTLYKAQVVHSLPGRLRLHIPYIKKVPKEWHIDSSYFTLAQRIKGIHKVEICFTTANALIFYDHKLLTETQVIQLFKEMANIGATHKDEFSDYKPHQKDEAIRHFTSIMSKHFDLAPE